MAYMLDTLTPHRRRWFQFRLQTLLIVMMLLAIPMGWLDWQVRVVRHRQAVLAMILLRGQDYAPHFDDADTKQPRLPWYRTLLGDEPLAIVFTYAAEYSEDEIREIKDTFPEAAVGPPVDIQGNTTTEPMPVNPVER
jgi:hypothetical protein